MMQEFSAQTPKARGTGVQDKEPVVVKAVPAESGIEDTGLLLTY